MGFNKLDKKIKRNQEILISNKNMILANRAVLEELKRMLLDNKTDVERVRYEVLENRDSIEFYCEEPQKGQSHLEHDIKSLQLKINMLDDQVDMLRKRLEFKKVFG